MFVIETAGWEKMRPQRGCTVYDEYGLSLVAVVMCKLSGALVFSTSRYNHQKSTTTGDAD